MDIVEKTRGLLRDYPDALEHYEQILRESRAFTKSSREFITTTQAAHILSVSIPTIHKMAREGLLSYVKVGKHKRFERKEVASYYRRMRQKEIGGV